MKKKKNSREPRTKPESEPIEFMVPFALPGNDEEILEQDTCYAGLKRLIAAWKGAKWEPWSAPKSIRLHVPESLAPLRECYLSDLDGDTLDEMRLYHLADLAAFQLYEHGRINRLAELGLRIARLLEHAKNRHPEAERTARESFGAWPVEVKAGRSDGGFVHELGRAGCVAWGVEPNAFRGDAALKRLALGLYATMQLNRSIIGLVNGQWRSLARWCKANEVGHPLLVPVWASKLNKLPDPPGDHWHAWRNFITRKFVGEIMGLHPAWGEMLHQYENAAKRRKGNHSAENLLTSHLKKYLLDLLHTKSA